MIATKPAQEDQRCAAGTNHFVIERVSVNQNAGHEEPPRVGEAKGAKTTKERENQGAKKGYKRREK